MVQPDGGGGAVFRGRPSEEIPEVLACGDAPAVGAVLSLSERAADGEDAAYLDWHLHDHLPEQYRLAGMRQGSRFVSTPACRDARVAEQDSHQAIDHVVTYLFGPPLEEGLAAFFELGAALRRAGRMPLKLPGVQVGSFDVMAMVAAPRARVGAAVVPWRPCTGILLTIEQNRSGDGDPIAPGGLQAMVATPGVVGAWALRGRGGTGRGPADTSGIEVTIAYLDAAPADVAASAGGHMDRRWVDGRLAPLLVAPFEAVDPRDVYRHLP